MIGFYKTPGKDWEIIDINGATKASILKMFGNNYHEPVVDSYDDFYVYFDGFKKNTKIFGKNYYGDVLVVGCGPDGKYCDIAYTLPEFINNFCEDEKIKKEEVQSVFDKQAQIQELKAVIAEKDKQIEEIKMYNEQLVGMLTKAITTCGRSVVITMDDLKGCSIDRLDVDKNGEGEIILRVKDYREQTVESGKLI